MRTRSKSRNHRARLDAVSETARRSIATACLSGTLEDKLGAAAAAGFDGIELFENDLIAGQLSPEQVRERCAELGLSIDLYQPFRDFEGAPRRCSSESAARGTRIRRDGGAGRRHGASCRRRAIQRWGCAWTASTSFRAQAIPRASPMYRLLPGHGAFDLPAFLGYVLDAGYIGPLSLEVFNDVVRQADPARTARDALRSLLWPQEQFGATAADTADLRRRLCRPAAWRIRARSLG